MPAADGEIDNKAVYARPEVAARFDAERRIGEDDFVYRWEIGHFLAQARRIMATGGGAGGGAGGGEGPGSLIDVGAGTGKLALAFARQGWRVTAFDHSEAMLDRLRHKAAAEGLEIACRTGDVLALDGERHDVAVSSRVLMHVADPAAMIARMTALAARGVVLDAPRRLSPNRLLVLARALTGGEVYRCFDDGFLRDAFAAQGFDTVALVRMFALPISLHVKLRSPGVSRLIETGLAPLGALASTAFVTAVRRGG